MIFVIVVFFGVVCVTCKGIYRKTFQKEDCSLQYDSAMYFYEGLCYPFHYVSETTWSKFSYDDGIATFVSGCSNDQCQNCVKNDTHKVDVCEFAFKTPHGPVYEFVQVLEEGPKLPKGAYYMAYFMNNDSNCTKINHAYGFVELSHCSEGKTSSYKLYCDENKVLQKATYNNGFCQDKPVSVTPQEEICSKAIIDRGYFYKISCDFFV